MKGRGFCHIHPTEPLHESHPADVENGPSPHDVENELFCQACGYELEAAYWGSFCLLHCLPLMECFECTVVDFMLDEEVLLSHGK